MGDTTTFTGELTLDPPLSPEEQRDLTRFAQTRRMARSRGPYFVDGSGDFGPGQDPDITDPNRPDPSQPGLRCQWIPSPDGRRVVFDDGEKFHHAAEWMASLLAHFIGPAPRARLTDPDTFAFLQGHRASGTFHARGESPSDCSTLIIEDGVTWVKRAGTRTRVDAPA